MDSLVVGSVDMGRRRALANMVMAVMAQNAFIEAANERNNVDRFAYMIADSIDVIRHPFSYQDMSGCKVSPQRKCARGRRP